MTCTQALIALCLTLVFTAPSQAQERWIDDTLIDWDATGMDRVVVDVKEDNSAWYALASGDQQNEQETNPVLPPGGPQNANRTRLSCLPSGEVPYARRVNR